MPAHTPKIKPVSRRKSARQSVHKNANGLKVVSQKPGKGQLHDSGRTASKSLWLLFGLFIGAAFLVYLPSITGGYVWDDDHYVTNNTELRSLGGLWRIWTQLGAVAQYYPLVFSSFWMEYHAWGLWSPGYHLVNVILHGCSAAMLYLLMQKLKPSLALPVALLFVVHPVAVESVQWITERKNVLSMFFYMGALLALWPLVMPEAQDEGAGISWKRYACGLVLFSCAMLSKTTACSLPAVLLVLAWYVDGKTWIRRIPAMIPFFIIGVCLAAVTVYTERVVVGTAIDSAGLRPTERIIVAGHALWFYAAKAVIPWPTMFVYPRWQLDVHSPMQYLWPVTAAAVLVTAWALRGKIGRGVAAALFIFAGTLVPALGFIDVYPFKFSFVADHFQYLALPAMLCLLCAGAITLFRRAAISVQTSRIALVAVALVFGVLAARQARAYISAESLYRDAIAKNPHASMPHNNLGQILARNGDLAGAEEQYRAAIAAEPDFGGAYFNLGDVLMRQGNTAKGGEAIEKAIALDPKNARLYFHAGLAYARQRNAERAIGYFEQAAKLKSDYVDPLLELGNVYAQTGHPEMAVPKYQQALALNDDNPIAHANLANAQATLGHLPEALAQFERALELDPADRQSWSNYAMALDQAGRHDDARQAREHANQLGLGR